MWEEWVLYMLTAVEQTARESIATVNAIKATLLETKHRIRATYKFYSQDLINTLFTHPYAKIQFVERDLNVSRLTATKYLDELSAGGILLKYKMGRSSYYINRKLYKILTGETLPS
jgi:Fic family protein